MSQLLYAVDRDVNAAKNILAARTLRFGVVALTSEAMVAEPVGLQRSAKSMRGS